jgi:hypothetical protein
MARPRKPTNVLELKGSFKKDPARGRERENEPEPDAQIGDPPGYFDEAQAEAYRELVKKAHAGVLSDADSVAVEAAAVLLARLRKAPDDFTAGEFGRLEAILGKLGMTPADRSKVSVPKKPKHGDPLDEFAAAG